jgi:hypothetical protein
MDATKKCAACNLVKALSNFYSNKSNNVYHNKCKVCELEVSKKRYIQKKNSEELSYICVKCSNLKPAEGFFQNGKRSRFCGDCNDIILLESLTEKQCTKCKFTKPISEYFVNKVKKHGRDAACKECMKVYNKSRVVTKIQVLEKKCYHCKTVKPINMFYKSKNSKDDHTTTCIACRKLFDKKHNEKHKDSKNLRKSYYRIFIPKYNLKLDKNASSEMIESKAFVRIINRSIKDLV